ncbi:MAG: hypothetical protein Roseis2KO_49910 [Roseivirga sp.]
MEWTEAMHSFREPEALFDYWFIRFNAVKLRGQVFELITRLLSLRVIKKDLPLPSELKGGKT